MGAGNVTIAADPSLPDLYRARFKGTPPKVRARGGVVAIEYTPGFAHRLGRQAKEITLNPSVRWRIEAPRGLERLRADLSAIQLGIRPCGPAAPGYAGQANSQPDRRRGRWWA